MFSPTVCDLCCSLFSGRLECLITLTLSFVFRLRCSSGFVFLSIHSLSPLRPCFPVSLTLTLLLCSFHADSSSLSMVAALIHTLFSISIVVIVILRLTCCLHMFVTFAVVFSLDVWSAFPHLLVLVLVSTLIALSSLVSVSLCSPLDVTRCLRSPCLCLSSMFLSPRLSVTTLHLLSPVRPCFPVSMMSDCTRL